MPFGGMPYDVLLRKLEETDSEYSVAAARGDDPFTTMEDRYDAYARSEIIDWAPDDTYLESDHPRRDPALPRSVLNLRHSGGRGPNDHRLPQHPELFLGFTGNDPRGADTQPRLDMARAQMAVRAREREVRMGHNVGHGDFIEADRPWSGPAFVYDQKEIQRRQKAHSRWFPAQKEGRPWGRNVVADEHYGLRQRRDIVSDESLHVPEQGQGGISAAWPHRSSYDPARGAETGTVRRVDGPGGSDKAPWRNTVGGANFAVQHYTGTAGGGRAACGSGAIGGARLGVVQVSHRPNVHNEDVRGVNRRILAESLGAAAIHRRALARASEGDVAHSSSAVGRRPGRSAPKLARDIAAAALLTLQDPVTRLLGDGGSFGSRSGLGAPPGDQQSALYRVQPSHVGAANVRLADTGAAVRGLREDVAADRRGASYLALPAHAEPANAHLANTEAAIRGLRDAEDLQRALHLTHPSHAGPANIRLANTEAAIRGLRNAEDLQRALHLTHPSHAGPANVRLANVGAMIRGLRGGVSADFRMVQGQVVLAGTESIEIGGKGGAPPGGGLTPSDDYISAVHASEMPLARAAASADLEIHCYGQRAHTNLRHPMDTVGTARRGGFSTPLAMMGRREGRSKAPQFRSHTQDSSVLGGHPDEFFGSVGEHSGPHTGGLSIGDKSFRATTLADKGDDTMDGREDFTASLSETS